MIVVIDSSVLVSALHFAGRNGTPRLALEKAMSESLIATCAEIENETRRILTVKFQWDSARANAELQRVLARSTLVQLRGNVKVCRDPADDMVLECALRAKADLLISGDRDLLVLRQFEGTKIITPAQYVASTF